MTDFTIVITSFNRPKCLLRNLKFLLSYNLSFKIIIADSSSSNDINENDELKILIDKNNILFKNFPHEIEVTQKISDTLKYVSTKYCVLCADDDFIIPTSIIECINFLKNNPDYVSCHGKYYCHTKFEYVKKFGIVFRDLSGSIKSCEQEDIIDRIDGYLAGNLRSQYIFYAVFETINLQTIWKQTSVYAKGWFLNESFSTIVSLIIGKMKTLPIFYVTREPNSTLPSHSTNQKEIEKLLSKEKNMRCSEGIVKNLIKYYPNLDLDESKKKYFNFYEGKKNRKIIKGKTLIHVMNKYSILKYLLRRPYYLYLKIIFKINNKSDSDNVKKIENLIIKSGDMNKEVKDSREKY